MAETTSLPPVFVLDRETVPPEHADAVLDGGAVAPAECSLIEISGPGAVTCIQGLLTNDIEGPGDGAFIYGAILTPKGMIVSDMWTARDGNTLTVSLQASAAPGIWEILHRYVPPRLAKPVDRTDDTTVLRLVGPRAIHQAEGAGIAIPPHNRSASTVVGEASCVVARPHEHAPFKLELRVSTQYVELILRQLQDQGMCRATSGALELYRILAGWPRVGAEIDQKTLPQEVRFDENEGVSYTKGCYTGQETVARLHFRGHSNRRLVGLVWDSEPQAGEPTIVQNGAKAGRVTSIAWLEPLEQFVGLGISHKKLDPAKPFTAGGVDATQVPLPFQID